MSKTESLNANVINLLVEKWKHDGAYCAHNLKTPKLGSFVPLLFVLTHGTQAKLTLRSTIKAKLFGTTAAGEMGTTNKLDSFQDLALAKKWKLRGRKCRILNSSTTCSIKMLLKRCKRLAWFCIMLNCFSNQVCLTNLFFFANCFSLSS